uniref:DNA-(apurinic or apyrimidinic site) endonuclease n=1 Tax=Araucaria cunninghamii TaxID=56994 RepID=A0A0D6R9B5_ARACU
MKRFFQPVEKDGSLSKKQNTNTMPEKPPEGGKNGKEPLKFMSWNANSLLLRMKKNRSEVADFVQQLDPDVIAIQEVRMPAAGCKGGTKNQGELKDDTSSAREEKQILLRAISTPPFSNYRFWWSLGEAKYGGVALLLKHHFQPLKVTFSLDQTCSALKHEVDGRVILAEFESFRILNSYVPNNGWKDDERGFKRRRKWDQRMLDFVLRLSDKPLIWCGDLNVSHEDIDVSHPEFFANAKIPGYTAPNKEDCGQPGFTLGERRRFSTILSQGKLLDTYRWLHKEQEPECGFTWSGNPVGKYRGKRMRIDYFLVSNEFKDRTVASNIHGRGIEMEGFLGSDHCPISLELSPVQDIS